MLTLKVFGDESADESAERVFALSAVVGVEDEWEPTVKEWVRLTGGAEFHANEFETEYVNHPDRTKHKARQEEYKALVQVLARSPLAGFCVSLDLQAFKELFHNDFEIGYYKCFADILNILAPLSRRWNESASPDDRVKAELTFDRRQGHGTILTLFDTFTEQPEWRGSDLFGTKVSFDTRANPRLQIADLIAREGMKDHDRLITGIPPKIRGAKAALDAANRYRFIRWERRDVEKWRVEQEQMEIKEGFNGEGYGKWLIDTGRVQHGKRIDNMRNRLMYMAWRDNQAILAKKSE